MKMESRVAGILSEKDRELRITHCNPIFLEYAGAKSVDEIIGHTDQDFPWQEHASVFRQHELNVLAGNSYSIIFPAKVAGSDEPLIFLHSKAPKYNQVGEIIGVFCHAVEIINPNMTKIFSYLNQASPENYSVFSIGKKTETLLTQREQDILFFIVKAKTAKQVARILNLSPRTVYSHIDHIKAKLRCHTKSELIDMAYQMGFAQELPSFTHLS